MSALPITTGYAALLALLLLALSMRVVDGRRRFGVNLGDGGNAAMQRRIRAHANFIEYVPLLLILLALLEAAALPCSSRACCTATRWPSRNAGYPGALLARCSASCCSSPWRWSDSIRQ